jgi:hypothetical protein
MASKSLARSAPMNSSVTRAGCSVVVPTWPGGTTLVAGRVIWKMVEPSATPPTNNATANAKTTKRRMNVATRSRRRGPDSAGASDAAWVAATASAVVTVSAGETASAAATDAAVAAAAVEASVSAASAVGTSDSATA